MIDTRTFQGYRLNWEVGGEKQEKDNDQHICIGSKKLYGSLHKVAKVQPNLKEAFIIILKKYLVNKMF